MLGEIPEWSKGADCKSASYAFVGSNPTLATSLRLRGLGLRSVNAATPGAASLLRPVSGEALA